MARVMNENDERHRIPVVARINIKPAAHEALRAIARHERLSVATLIGAAIDQFLTARST